MKDFILIDHSIIQLTNKKLFKNVGMKLYDIEKIDVHGGSLRLYKKFIRLQFNK